MDLSSSASRRPINRHAVVGGAASVVILCLIGVGAYFSVHHPTQTLTSEIIPTPRAKLNDGYSIPLLGLGTSGARGEVATKAVRTGLEIGYRHIDTAAMYGNEEAIGVALAEALKAGVVTREELFITTKLKTEDHAREAVEPALRASLSRLQLDYVDLYLVHWPVTNHPGPALNPPMEETWLGMEEVALKNLTRSIGVSNQSPEKIDAWYKKARIVPAVNQIEVHAHWRNDRVLEYAKANNIHITAYAPLSSPGTMASRGEQVPNLQQDPKVTTLAKNSGKTPQQVLLQWGLQHGDYQHVSVIPKSANADHQKGNFGTLHAAPLSSTDYNTINSLAYQRRYFNGTGLGITKEGPWYSYEDLWNESPDIQHF